MAHYLFFDTECCDGFHICEFGYVISDAEFNITDRGTILINPEKPFRLGRKGFEPRIKLHYSEKEYKSAPNFKAKYSDIKTILENKEYVICGHSLDSDVNYLHRACQAYGKPFLKFEFFDSQLAYKLFKGNKNVSSLESISADLNISTDGIHKAECDAEITLKICKELCKLNNMTFAEFIEKYKKAKSHSKNIIIAKTKKPPTTATIGSLLKGKIDIAD